MTEEQVNVVFVTAHPYPQVLAANGMMDSAAAKFPHALVSGVREKPVFGRVLMSLPLGGCTREKQHRISIRCFSSEVKTDPGREARWR